ncbi:collagen alpha-1(I) chain-like [Phasianus colchicus]|uniref:collagen alpha-1(I) chain-like n=1 Tax=Phasianus colchicus TaxID=9054 RepID=UPI00129E3AAF|nr:collagen alpha-1(I) chain-like [Phasianus colchicus]
MGRALPPAQLPAAQLRFQGSGAAGPRLRLRQEEGGDVGDRSEAAPAPAPSRPAPLRAGLAGERQARAGGCPGAGGGSGASGRAAGPGDGVGNPLDTGGSGAPWRPAAGGGRGSSGSSAPRGSPSRAPRWAPTAALPPGANGAGPRPALCGAGLSAGRSASAAAARPASRPLARVQPSVGLQLRILFLHAAFRPLCPKPAAMPGVVVTKVRDPACGGVEPRAVGISRRSA